MKKSNYRNCYANFNKHGELISYRFFYTGTDPETGKAKQYTKTWKIPYGLSKKDIDRERRKAEDDFISECEHKSNGTFNPETNILFRDFADQWLEELRLRGESTNSYAGYESGRTHLPILKQHFGDYMLRNITPQIVQKFYNYLATRTYTKTIVTVKRSIKELLTENKLSQAQLSRDCGLDVLTIRTASKVGEQTSVKTARAISKHFGVPIEKYFNIEETQVPYAAATNKGIRTALVMILNSAKKQLLIEHNYATKDYTHAISGTTKSKKIYNEEQSKEFIRCAMEEKDIRKKTMFLLLIGLGLRNSELCGLEWGDIDFNNARVYIQRNSIYFPKIGILTKEPKTKNSKRIVAIPEPLIQVLREYKTWWDLQKELHGDLWEYSKRLFLRDDGQPMFPHTTANWLTKFQTRHGLERVSPHALRHTNITLQIMSGINPKVVAQRVGHANEAITMNIYTHVRAEDDILAAQTFGKYLSV